MKTAITPRSSAIFSTIAGCSVFVVGFAVLVGWMFDIAALKGVSPGLVTMKANTAIGMLLCGGAVALLSSKKTLKPIRLWTSVMAVVVVALGTLTLCEYLLGLEFGIDQLLFHEVGGTVGYLQPGRMSPATAFCFLLTGCSLLVASRPSVMPLRRSSLAALDAAVIGVGGLALIGYISDALFGLRWWNYTGMALQSAVGFLLLGCGLLALLISEGGLTWSLDALTTGGFAIAVVSLITAAGISYHFTNQLQQSAAWVSHTQEVLKEIEEVSAGVAALGSSQRSYINTGDEHSLEPERAIRDAIHENINALRKLTADNFQQQHRLNQLEPLISQRIDWGERVVAIRRQQGLSAAEQIVVAGRGIVISDNIRHVTREIEDEEYSLLDQRQKKEQAISTTTFLLLPLGVFLSLAMLSLGLFFLNASVSERARAEKKSDWLASFPERNPNPIVELDLADGVVHYVNPSAIRLFPNLQSEGLAHLLLSGLHAAQTAMPNGQTEMRREISTGEFFFAQTISYIPEVRRLRIYSTDITERKHSEMASTRLAAIVESSDDAIIGKDPNGIITNWNRGAEKIFGYTAKEIVGTSIMRLTPADRQDEEEQILEKIKGGESVEHFETLRQTKDGRLIDVSITASPIKDTVGNVIGVSKVARDISERKRAVQAMSESEARFRTMANSMSQLAWIARSDGFIFWYNQRWHDYTGTTPKDMEGWGWQSVHDPEWLPTVLVSWKDAIATGKVFDMEFPLRGADGIFRPFLTRGMPVKDQAGRVVQWFGTNTDISEQKRTEAALRNSEAQLKTIVENMDEGVVVSDLNGQILQFNRAALAMHGFASMDECRRHLTEFADTFEFSGMDGAIWPVDQWPLARILRGEKLSNLETRIRRIHADWQRVFNYGGMLVHDSNGQRLMAIVSMSDITSRKEAEVKLQAQLARLALLNQITRAIGERLDLQSILQIVIRSLEDNLPVDFSCVCLYDEPTNTLKVVRVGLKSEPIAMELAMSEQAVIPIEENGLALCVRGQLVYEPDISQVQFPFPQRLARGGLSSLVLAPLLVESKVFGVLVAARRQPQGFVSAECEFLKQLSEHVGLAAHQSQLYGALQQAYDDLRLTQQSAIEQERLRALGQMASGIAHDINNAISPIGIYAEALLENEPNLSERTRKYLEVIGRAIDDVAQTVARMGEFYRQREPQMTLAPVDLNQLVQQVIDLSRARWNDMPQQRGLVINLTTDLLPNLPAIMGVESEIRDALINLIFNAVDAMPEGGTLTLRTKVGEAAPTAPGFPAFCFTSMEVTDTGVGMDEDTRRRCLEPFFTTKGERGTGLGLAMVFGTVKRHSAEIEIESVVGKGTTVRLNFAATTTHIIEAAHPARTNTISSRLRVLIVDDDPLVIKSLRDALETDGHVVVTAPGGQAGIDAFRAAKGSDKPFAVVITDLGMPYVDGRKVATEVKAASPTTPVIMLTGWGQRLVAEGEIPPHVDRVLNKPPKLRELRAALIEVTAELQLKD